MTQASPYKYRYQGSLNVFVCGFSKFIKVVLYLIAPGVRGDWYLSYSASDSVSDSVTVGSSILPGYTDMSSMGGYDCVTVGSFTYCDSPPPTITTDNVASPSSSPSQGITITSVVNDVVYAISVIFDSIARAIIEFAPYLIAFPSAVFIVGHAYNAVRGVVWRFFGRYFRI